jgi:hypothetical protein
MKKIYLSAAILACSLLNAQSAFTWDVTSYKGAFPVTDNTPATDWTNGWAEWDPENEPYSAPTSTLTGNIVTTTTISGVVYLDGFVNVVAPAELYILPGTVIRGKQTDVTVTPGVLIITRGAKIHANGTAANPIVFTSIKSIAAGRAGGDWGGLAICGNAKTNTHTLPTAVGSFKEAKLEGFTTTDPNGYRNYGGNNDADNSGELSYVRIEFAGVSLNPAILNNEINGLTLGGVGSGTKIDHIQVSFCGDDSFEWFGGTVDAKYLISNRTRDDDFDTDNGFSGRIQFGLAIRDPYIADDADPSYASNGFECDNNGTSPYYALPITKAVFSNITMVGPYGDGTAYGDIPGINARHAAGAHLRRNMAQSVFNSLFVGWKQGLRYQGGNTKDNLTATAIDSSAAYANNIITDVTSQTTYVNDGTTFDKPWYHAYASANNVDTLTTASQIAFVNAWIQLGSGTPDYRLQAASTASTGASFTNSNIVGGVTGVNQISKLVVNSFVVYPNPANSSTSISFDIAENNKVTILVYNVLGNLVSNLSQSNDFEKGNNTISLKTSNLTSGIYYIVLEINGSKETKKIIINN